MFDNNQYLSTSDSDLSNATAEAMRRVYNYMGLGLFITAIVAFGLQLYPGPLVAFITAVPYGFLILMGVELALVFGLASVINKLSPTAALAWFLVYAAVNGISLTVIFWLYELGDIVIAFGATTALFLAMSIIGYTTKMDLTKMGSFLLMALVGLIIASLANFFLQSSALDWILTYVGLAIFIGLTVYHTQRIKRATAAALLTGNEDALKRVAIIGALSLYLDFINLFLRLLRILGGRRR